MLIVSADLMDGSPEEVAPILGHVPTEGERRLWIEQQGGTGYDKRKLVEIARKKAEHDLAEAHVTASRVKRIIEQQKTTRRLILWALDFLKHQSNSSINLSGIIYGVSP